MQLQSLCNKCLKTSFLPLLIILIIYCSVCKAQKPAEVFAIAKYKFSHVTDTLKPGSIYEEQMILYLGKTASMYQSYDNLIENAIRTTNAKSKEQVNQVTSGSEGSTAIFYLYPSEQKFFQTEKMFVNHYLFPLLYPQINWEIKADTITIGNLKCQKAIGSWKGRRYISWFCPDLPFSYGPWKLNGLPGLILEAYDEKKQVKFEFLGFEANKNPERKIDFPKEKVQKVTKEEFDRLQKLFSEDPKAYLQSIFGAKGMGSVNISPSFTGYKPPQNPLELEKSK